MGRKGPRAKTKIVLKSVKQWEQLGNMHNLKFQTFLNKNHPTVRRTSWILELQLRSLHSNISLQRNSAICMRPSFMGQPDHQKFAQSYSAQFNIEFFCILDNCKKLYPLHNPDIANWPLHHLILVCQALGASSKSVYLVFWTQFFPSQFFEYSPNPQNNMT